MIEAALDAFAERLTNTDAKNLDVHPTTGVSHTVDNPVIELDRSKRSLKRRAQVVATLHS